MTELASVPTRFGAAPQPLDARAIEEIVAAWQARLGLSHWKITVDWQNPAPPGDDGSETLADINRTSVYEYATIRVGPSWETWDRRWANLTLVHELCHMLVCEVWPAVEPVEEFVPAAAWSMVKARFDHVEEQLVDRLASMLVANLGVV